MDFGIPPAMTVWLGLAIVFGTLEILSAGFFFIFFAGGALIAALLSIWVDSVMIQSVVFVVVSLLNLALARPLLKKTLQIGDRPPQESAVSALIGAEILVTETVDKYQGKAKVIHTGEIWSAYMAPGFENTVLEAGQPGEIVKVDGAKLAIRPKST